jgi:oligopeptide/dipeptide ABC transporter ATP-binding protein
MIFQEPMTALDPVFTIGSQLREAIVTHRPELSRDDADELAITMLERVGISDARRRLGSYPHEFSGGMRQRVMIAMALAMEPDLLIADEPTTALDVTIQAQILELMLKVRERTGLASVLLITHDLAVVAETCDRVAVMYGGEIQEIAETGPLFRQPLHPYAQGLLASLPRPDRPRRERLDAIPGSVPSILELPSGCKFVTRCPARIPLCEQTDPELREHQPGRWCRCHVVEQRLAAGMAPPRAFPWDGGTVDVATPEYPDPRPRHPAAPDR